MNKNFTNLTDLDIQNLIDLYQNGTSLTKIKLQFKISDKRVKQILTEHNIHIRSHRESKLVYQYNEDYFNQIDTPDKAYWLGFIYADGFITKKTNGNPVFGMSLAEIEPLEKLNKYMHSNKPIGKYNKVNSYNENSVEYKLAFCSLKLTSDLEKWGCTENKTFKLKFPTFLEDSLIRHFIRGYFDGDGSIFYRQNCINNNKYIGLGITICGIESFLTEMCKHLPINVVNCVYKDYRKTTECYSLKLNSNIRCLQLYHYLYNDCGDLYLSRKRKKFEDFIKEKGSTTIISNLPKWQEYLNLCYLED